MPGYDLKSLLEKLRDERPLVHNITNYVVMNFTANTLLAMGASPVMAHAVEEVEVRWMRTQVLHVVASDEKSWRPQWLDDNGVTLQNAFDPLHGDAALDWINDRLGLGQRLLELRAAVACFVPRCPGAIRQAQCHGAERAMVPARKCKR